MAWLAASLTALALYPVHSQADGIVQSLPEDGRWARFDLEREHIGADGEAVKTSTGTLTVSSVGTKTVDGEHCRWIEIKEKVKHPLRGESITMFKMLLPEERLRPGEPVLERVHNGWRKLGDTADGTGGPAWATAKPHEINALNLGFVQNTLGGLLYDPPDQVQQLGPKVIETPLGKLSCPGTSGTATRRGVAPGRRATEYRYEVRVNRDVPFGVVTHRSELRRAGQGDGAGEVRIVTLKLAEVGDGAKSELPDDGDERAKE